MKPNTKVSWLVTGMKIRGNGVIITDLGNGKVLVSVNSMSGEPNAGFHPVIYCTITWLTVEE